MISLYQFIFLLILFKSKITKNIELILQIIKFFKFLQY